jgi:hypothetical protein
MRLRIAGCLLICAAAAFGQADRGTITGTVLDPGGAVIPNAAVEARNVATDFKFTAGTSNTGNYTLTQIPTGTYEFTVTVPGFKKYVRPGIIVPVAETVRVDATLEVGAPTDTITVNAEAPLLKTESGEISHQIEFVAADQLPLFTTNGTGTGLGNIRDPLSVLNLLPGASQTTDTALRINGLPANSQLIMVEGMDATNGLTRTNNQAVQQATDAIQEVSVQTSNFAAEYGQAGGGYLNFTMKSGTNQYHGTAYDYFVNEAFNAGLPFTSQPCYTGPAGCTDHIKNDVRRNDYGFTLGGPVRIPKLYNGTNKTFFFFNFEQFRQATVTNNGIATMPLTSYTTGNFQAAQVFYLPPVCPGPSTPTAVLDNVPCYPANTIFDSTTRHTLAHGTIVENPFPNNSIPFSLMDPVALYLQSTFPKANPALGALNNYIIPPYAQFKHTTIPSVKIDQALSAKMKLSGYFNDTMTNANNTTGFAENIEPNTPSASRAQTYRINFDDTVTPTLLAHFGVGLLYFTLPSVTQTSNYTGQAETAAATVGANYAPFPASEYIPSFAGLNNGFAGGLALGSGFFAPSLGNGSLEVIQHEVKPTANASLTWVHGNHTFKTGANMVLDGYPQNSSERAFGEYTFSNVQTENPYEQTLANNFFPTGFNYASFLLGQVYNTESSAVNDTRLGNHAWGLYLQDNWKVTHKLTLEYGLRWDYATIYSEEHGAMSDANFYLPNPALTSPNYPNGQPGSIVYGATNKGPLDNTYPFSIGPHLGVAYQINPKTVIRAGGAISYATAPDNQELSYSVANFYVNGASGFGLPSNLLKNGNPFSGPFALTFPEYNQFPFPTSLTGCGPTGATACVPPTEPFITIAKGAGRLPRVWQWSIGIQREIMPNLLVEAAYVGNRGTWFSAPLADTQSFNGTTPERYANLLTEGPNGTPLFGATSNINLNNPTDFNLLALPISSPAVIARFPQLANPNNVYLGFPSSEPLSQALRPYPQWFGVPNFLGPPMGDTWYDSLQVKVTKRFSHGFSAQGAYTWSKSLTIDANSNTSYFTPGTIVLNDPYNAATLKELSALNIPQAMVISFSYTTPKIMSFLGDNAGGKAVRWLGRDWTFSGVLRYQSGALIQSPASGNNLWNAMGIGSGAQSGTFGNGESNFDGFGGGGSNALENVVAGQSCLAINPNSHFDPTKTLALNPNAWVDQDTIPGQTETFGTAAPYYANCRWQRQPSESLSAGRIFRVKEKYQLMIQAQFFNVFNRVFYSAPSVVSSTTAPSFGNNFANGEAGALSSGFGFVNSVAGAGANPRSGQLVVRFTF